MSANFRSLVPGGFFSSTPFDRSMPVSIRCNNPGAINGTAWEKMYPGYVDTVETTPGNKTTIFEAPEYGVAVWWELLRRYAAKNARTVGGIINRYGGGQDYSSYISFVLSQTGFGEDKDISLDDDETLLAFGKAMFRYEAGRPTPLSDTQITFGLHLGRADGSADDASVSFAAAAAVLPVSASQESKRPGSGRLLCLQRSPKPLMVTSQLSPARASAIQISAKKWVNGTVLHYYFLNSEGPSGWRWVDSQKEIVRWAIGQWKAIGIGLSFVEVQQSSEAEILIGCAPTDGSWSLVGTDNLDAESRDQGRTLNYGWDLTTEWGRATALHELGHAIGFSHEHQSPYAGIVWNEDAVYAYFSGPPNNWSRPKIYSNIIQKLDASQTQGTHWDPTSIMEYPFEPGLIKTPAPYDTQGVGENTTISSVDIASVKLWYPPLANARQISSMDLKILDAASGQQSDFKFSPDATRNYTITTVGRSDCRLVVFEVRDGTPRYLNSDDDSGSESNLKLNTNLVLGREYIIRVRVNYVTDESQTGLLIY